MTVLIYTIFITFILSFTSNKNTLLNNKYIHCYFIVSFFLISTYIVSITDVNYIDRFLYTSNFTEAKGVTLYEYLNSFTGDYLFRYVTWQIAQITSSVELYYISLHLLFIIPLIIGVKYVYNNELVVLSLFLYLNLIFYYSYSLNVLRQGIAMALIVLAVRYLIEKKGAKLLLTIGAASLFHLSSLFFSVIMIYIYFVKRIKFKYSITIYIISSIMYITKLSDNLINLIPYSTGYMNTYSSERLIENFGGSYKLDFLMFNTIFLILFLLAVYKINSLKGNDIYMNLLNIYILFSSIFFLVGFVAFADRVAAYSWFLIPLLIALIIREVKISFVKFAFLLVVLLIGVFTTPLIPN